MTSRLSLWSTDSFLSIGSRGSVLSIGSVGSVLLLGSAVSFGSALSWLALWSVLSERSRGGVMGPAKAPCGGSPRACEG